MSCMVTAMVGKDITYQRFGGNKIGNGFSLP